eukprot:COSAG02_NODE_50960_length_317_cov_0.802752_1_plen_75_part_01
MCRGRGVENEIVVAGLPESEPALPRRLELLQLAFAPVLLLLLLEPALRPTQPSAARAPLAARPFESPAQLAVVPV